MDNQTQMATKYPSHICDRCQGTGHDPDGWTLEDARENPREWNASRLLREHGPNHRFAVMSANVVSPLLFDGSIEKCVACHGSGVASEAIKQDSETKRERIRKHFQAELGGLETVTLPEGCQFVTIQAFYDDSDTMTDYFNRHASLGPRFVMAIAKGNRHTEAAARKSLASAPELQKLTWKWHKENYSMGHGYWLESSPIGTIRKDAYDGRTEVSYRYEIRFERYEKSLPASKWYGKPSEPKKEAKPVSSGNGKTAIRRNEERNGIEVQFSDKPERSVLDSLKSLGFRWSGKQALWYARYTPALMAHVSGML